MVTLIHDLDLNGRPSGRPLFREGINNPDRHICLHVERGRIRHVSAKMMATHTLAQLQNPAPGKDGQAASSGPASDGEDQDARSGATIVVETLKTLGVDTIFGYPGGAVLPIYDELFKQDGITHILVRHEQAAAHAAEGYARSTGKPGVVLVTSGPGATNVVTGLTDALMDSIPMVCISGQVPRGLVGTDAFQEADTVGITRPCTKHNYLVKSAGHLETVIREAFFVATSGRPGPVVVDIPKDVQVETEGDVPRLPLGDHRGYRPASSGKDAAVRKAVKALKSAKKPILYVGGGVINAGAGACDKLLKLAEKSGSPVTCTLMGLGAFPSSHPQSVGMLGMHGTYEANMAMYGCDVMLALGSRFDDRVTGRLDGFSPDSFKFSPRAVIEMSGKALRRRFSFTLFSP